MNEIQASLNAILNNGSIGQALSYAGIAVAGFAVASLLFRSVMMVMLGAVATFYIFFLNTPEAALDKATAASSQLVTQMAQASECAAGKIEHIRNIGVVIRNGDVLTIAGDCGLLPR
ncbi:hypothetical protein [Providencia rettgeri]|uniref:hypothetical protein n=1 Tax=Providencia rettgeri TaxID=587 RepID=UPI0025569FCC|nr:hypothetical protein [Providencia rettgeri]